MLPRVDTNVEFTFTFIIDVKCLECFIVGPNGFNMMPKEALVYQKTHVYIYSCDPPLSGVSIFYFKM